MTINRNKNNLITFILLLAALQSSGLAEEYRIDSQEQFDAHRTTTFSPGDQILFKRGVQWNGMFAPLGTGTEQAPIRIDVYGEGQRPRINANGKHQAGLLLQDPSYWEANGLEITNTDGRSRAAVWHIRAGVWIGGNLSAFLYQRLLCTRCKRQSGWKKTRRHPCSCGGP